MRKMRKLVSLLCAMVMVFGLTAPAGAAAAAASNSFPPNSYIEELDEGDLFTLLDDEKAVVIITNDNDHLIRVSIKYNNQDDNQGNCDIVHEWLFDQYPVSVFTPENPRFWTDIIDFAEDRIDAATTVTITSISVTDEVSIPQPYNSATADLIEALEEHVGSGEYSSRFKYRNVYEGQEFRIYESLKFEVSWKGLKSWEKAIAVGSLVTTILGAVPVPATVKAICIAFGVVVSATTILDPGQMNEYLATARSCRFTTINNSAYNYNITYKYDTFFAYENADLNNTERAQLGSEEITYDGLLGETYYNDFRSQMLDAYNTFKILGQKP